MYEDFFTRTRRKIRYFVPIIQHTFREIVRTVESLLARFLSTKKAASLAVLVFIAIAATVFIVPEQQQVVYIRDTKIPVEIVATTPARSKGLSGRTALAKGHGMLFVFGDKARYGIWMNDMRFSLDILWINDNVVVDVVEQAPVPTVSDDVVSYTPDTVANYVLEVEAGTVQTLGVRVGDVVDIRL